MGRKFWDFFASPRVFAEIINYYHANLSPLINNGDIVIDPNATVTNEEITQVTNSTVEVISTDMFVTFQELDGYTGPLSFGPLNVLSDDIQNSLFPQTVPYNYSEFGLIVEQVSLLDNINNSPEITSSIIGVVDENAPVETVIYDVEATDPENDTITYSLGVGGDPSLLSIDSDDGEVRFSRL